MEGRAPYGGHEIRPAQLQGSWLLLWDGDCGLCRRSVAAWLRGAQPAGPALRALPYQQALTWLPPELAERARREVLLWAPDGTLCGGADAWLELLRLRGHGAWARLLKRQPLRAALRLGYRWVARHRGLLGRLRGGP